MRDPDDKVGEYYQRPAQPSKPEPRRYDPPKPVKDLHVKTLSKEAIAEIMEMFKAKQRGEISEQAYQDFLITLKNSSF